jgi:tetratricopeptide (TPR) repeat protein
LAPKSNVLNGSLRLTNLSGFGVLSAAVNPPDRHYLRAAHGYLELEMYSEAAAELDKIDPVCLILPEVLSVRLLVYAGLQNWGMMQSVAKRLSNCDPKNVQWAISLAYSTRRAESIEKAKLVLLEARKLHPEEPMIAYNLACYECQLGNLAPAKDHLMCATKADAKFSAMALDDLDLEPLWKEIGRLEA